MAGRRPTWQDRFPDQVTCVRCLQVKDLTEMDRLLGCEDCRHSARNRAGWWGWLGGLLFGAAVAAYVWIVVRPDDLVIGGWFGTLAAAIWVGSKISREIVYGAMRFRGTRAVEAVPPQSPPPA